MIIYILLSDTSNLIGNCRDWNSGLNKQILRSNINNKLKKAFLNIYLREVKVRRWDLRCVMIDLFRHSEGRRLLHALFRPETSFSKNITEPVWLWNKIGKMKKHINRGSIADIVYSNSGSFCWSEVEFEVRVNREGSIKNSVWYSISQAVLTKITQMK